MLKFIPDHLTVHKQNQPSEQQHNHLHHHHHHQQQQQQQLQQEGLPPPLREPKSKMRLKQAMLVGILLVTVSSTYYFYYVHLQPDSGKTDFLDSVGRQMVHFKVRDSHLGGLHAQVPSQLPPEGLKKQDVLPNEVKKLDLFPNGVRPITKENENQKQDQDNAHLPEGDFKDLEKESGKDDQEGDDGERQKKEGEGKEGEGKEGEGKEGEGEKETPHNDEAQKQIEAQQMLIEKQAKMMAMMQKEIFAKQQAPGTQRPPQGLLLPEGQGQGQDQGQQHQTTQAQTGANPQEGPEVGDSLKPDGQDAGNQQNAAGSQTKKNPSAAQIAVKQLEWNADVNVELDTLPSGLGRGETEHRDNKRPSALDNVESFKGEIKGRFNGVVLREGNGRNSQNGQNGRSGQNAVPGPIQLAPNGIQPTFQRIPLLDAAQQFEQAGQKARLLSGEEKGSNPQAEGVRSTAEHPQQEQPALKDAAKLFEEAGQRNGIQGVQSQQQNPGIQHDGRQPNHNPGNNNNNDDDDDDNKNNNINNNNINNNNNNNNNNIINNNNNNAELNQGGALGNARGGGGKVEGNSDNERWIPPAQHPLPPDINKRFNDNLNNNVNSGGDSAGERLGQRAEQALGDAAPLLKAHLDDVKNDLENDANGPGAFLPIIKLGGGGGEGAGGAGGAGGGGGAHDSDSKGQAANDDENDSSNNNNNDNPENQNPNNNNNNNNDDDRNQRPTSGKSGIPLQVFDLRQRPEHSTCVPVKVSLLSATVCARAQNYLSDSEGHLQDEKLEIVLAALESDSALGVVDLGAGLGVFTLAAASKGRPVVAVEPFAQNIPLFHATIHLNAVEGQVTLITDALGDTVSPGQIKFPSSDSGDPAYESGDLRGAYVRPIELSDVRGNTPNLVRIVRLDDIIPLVTFKRALVKMSVQGDEGKVLTGAKKFFSQIDVQFVLVDWQPSQNRPQYQLTAAFLGKQGLQPVRDADGTDVYTDADLNKDLNFVLWKKKTP